MGRIPANIRLHVRTRANNRCEYCRVHQEDDPAFQFHVEHIVARKHRGISEDSNLALSCHHCNLHKGPNLSGIDPRGGKTVPLFNPRTDQWSTHFVAREGLIEGRTPTGRATVEILVMNVPARVELRKIASSSA